MYNLMYNLYNQSNTARYAWLTSIMYNQRHIGLKVNQNWGLYLINSKKMVMESCIYCNEQKLSLNPERESIAEVTCS